MTKDLEKLENLHTRHPSHLSTVIPIARNPASVCHTVIISRSSLHVKDPNAKKKVKSSLAFVDAEELLPHITLLENVRVLTDGKISLDRQASGAFCELTK
jgi:hypothetical protein